jgi:hypothetical protein
MREYRKLKTRWRSGMNSNSQYRYWNLAMTAFDGGFKTARRANEKRAS